VISTPTFGFHPRTHQAPTSCSTVQRNSGTTFCTRQTIRPLDILLGRDAYSERDLREERVDVVMPEGKYPATVRVYESTWRRPRWPWVRRMVRTEITPDTPIPHGSKWGNDATYNLSSPAATAAEAAQRLADAVMRYRRRYGSGLPA